MPSDSIAGFLDQAKANRVLYPEQVEQLIRQPDIPQSDLNELCEYLEARRVLTRFQAETLRDGRGHELTFAKYPLVDEIGPCPGGIAYKATHPSLRTPVVVRRFSGEALAPADTTGGFIARARAAASVHHDNLAPLLDAGFHEDEAYAAFEPPSDIANLHALVKEIGPMPVFLAAEYGRQVASALRAAHERGINHGDVRPANLLIGPMTSKTGADGMVKRRPAPTASVKLAELGLVPLRSAWSISDAMALAYFPPERVSAATFDPRGDLYGLGGSLYYLLTGRTPFTGATAEEVIEKLRSSEPAALSALRPDLPADLVDLVMNLLAKKPGDRPSTAFDVEATLAKFGRSSKPPVGAGPKSSVLLAHAVPDTEEAPAAEEDSGWNQADVFSTSHAKAEPPVRKPRTEEEKAKTRLYVILGLILHLTASTLCVWLLVIPLVCKKVESPSNNPGVTNPDKENKQQKGPIRNPRDIKKDG
jgi:serine/threonine protein kinase